MAMVAVAIGAGLGGWPEKGSSDDSSVLLDGGDRAYTFEELGLSQPMVLTTASPTASMRLRLPDGATQGSPYWYGLSLEYEWMGMPDQGQLAYLFAKWNELSVYQLKVKAASEHPSWVRAEWSMVDGVNGGAKAYEVSDRIHARSTNFAPFKAIQAGENILTLELHTDFAPTLDATVTISDQSKIIVTSWQATHFAIRAEGGVSDDGVVSVHARAQNQGWDAPDAVWRTILYYPEGKVTQRSSTSAGRVAAGASIELEEEWLASGRPLAMDLVLDWGTGSTPLRLWQEDASVEAWWFVRLPWVTAWGCLAAFCVLWVGVPYLFNTMRSSAVQVIPGWVSLSVAAAAAISLVVGIVVLWTGRGESAGFSLPAEPYPLPRERELPAPASDKTERVLDQLRRDISTPEMAADQVTDALPVTLGGAEVGYFMELTGYPTVEPVTGWVVPGCGLVGAAQDVLPPESQSSVVQAVRLIFSWQVDRLVGLYPVELEPEQQCG
jgi:hypothetical protein